MPGGGRYAECLGKAFIDLPLFYLKRPTAQRRRKGLAAS